MRFTQHVPEHFRDQRPRVAELTRTPNGYRIQGWAPFIGGGDLGYEPHFLPLTKEGLRDAVTVCELWTGTTRIDPDPRPRWITVPVFDKAPEAFPHRYLEPVKV